MKNVKLLLVLSIALFLTVSCDKSDPVTEVYAYGIYDYSSSGGIEALGDLAIIENYFNEKGIFSSGKIIEAETTEKANEQAIALYDESVAKINASELAALVNGSVTFKYCLFRATSSDSSNDSCLKEKEFNLNQDL